MARRLLIVFVPATFLLIGGIAMQLLAARPERVWWLALLPLAAMLSGPRTRLLVVVALVELATLVPLHAFVTLLRAARLEGG